MTTVLKLPNLDPALAEVLHLDFLIKRFELQRCRMRMAGPSLYPAESKALRVAESVLVQALISYGHAYHFHDLTYRADPVALELLRRPTPAGANLSVGSRESAETKGKHDQV